MRRRSEGGDARPRNNTEAIMDFLDRRHLQLKNYRTPKETVENRFTKDELKSHEVRLERARKNRKSSWEIDASAEGADAETMFPYMAEALLTDEDRVLVYATRTHPYDDEVNHTDAVLAFCSVTDPECDSYRVAVDVTSAKDQSVVDEKILRNRDLVRSGDMTELLYGPVPNLKNLPLVTVGLSREQLGEFAAADEAISDSGEQREKLKNLRGDIVRQINEELTDQLALIEQAQKAGRMNDADAEHARDNINGALKGLIT